MRPISFIQTNSNNLRMLHWKENIGRNKKKTRKR